MTNQEKLYNQQPELAELVDEVIQIYNSDKSDQERALNETGDRPRFLLN